MKIQVDVREKKLIPLIKALNNDYGYNIEIESKQLDLGDLIVCDDDNNELLIIERKTLTDLASSIRDGRYSEQSYRLNKESLHNHNVVYLIEGKMENYMDKYTKIKSQTLYVTMGCIQYYKGFSVMRTRDILETAEYIIRFVDKMGREKKKGYYNGGEQKGTEAYSGLVTRVKKSNVTPENIGEIILNQIPGISKATSLAIMKKFNSLYNLLHCLKKDPNCMNTLTYITKSGSERRISKTSIRNIVQYLLYQKTNVVKINTN